MPKIQLTEAENIIFWYDRLLKLLATKQYKQLTEDDVVTLYPHANINIIKKAVQKLLIDNKVEITT